MPLGIISNKEFESELLNSGTDNAKREYLPAELVSEDKSSHAPEIPIPQTAEVIDIKSVGRHADVGNVPLSLKKILAEEHAINGLQSAKDLAAGFGGLSQPTLSTYGRGETSNGNHKSDDTDKVHEFLNNRKTKISKRALNKLNLALSHLDDSKLQGLEARELSGVAKDMAIVAKQMEPTQKNSENEGKNTVQFIMYAPSVRSESHYDIVQAKDNY